MSLIYLYILAASALTSAISLVGVLAIIISKKKFERIIMFLVSLSAGTLLGDSFIHLLPEASENSGQFFWLAVIGGILLFFVLEKIIHWRHCHLQPTMSHPHPVGLMNLVGDGLHNLIDGLIIGGSFLVSVPLGIATTIAVITHEIPQELGDFGTLLHAGYKVKKAVWLNFLSALASILGAVLAIVIGVRATGFVNFIIPITAGGFIYIATSDLIPELKKDSRLRDTARQLLGIVLGVGVMVLLKMVNI
jgi:zinc and cadmium transporter